jgi:hypothetical protein
VTSGAIALAAGAAAQLTMSTQPPASNANNSALTAAPAVQLRDGAGNPVTTTGVNVTIGLVGAGATLGGPTSAASSGGVATFPNLVITGTVGSYSLAFSATGLTGTTSNAINLTAGSANQLSMSTQPPSTAVSGTAFATAPAVQLRDVSGNLVSASGVSVSASLNGAGGSLSGSAAASTNGSGIATFSSLGISGPPGSYSLTFTSGSLTGITSSSITVTLPASQLAVLSQPSPNAINGSPFAAQPAVQMRDANGTPVNQSGVLVTVALSGGSGSLDGTAQATTVNGVATFTNLGITGLVGNYTLTFSGGGLTDAVSGVIALAAGAATQLTVSQQPSGIAASGIAFGQQPIMQLRDPEGNPVLTSGVSVSVAIASGPAGANLIGSTSATSSGSGAAGFTNLGISGPLGVYTLTFSAPGVASVTSGNVAVLSFAGTGQHIDATTTGSLNGTNVAAPNTSRLAAHRNPAARRTSPNRLQW